MQRGRASDGKLYCAGYLAGDCGRCHPRQGGHQREVGVSPRLEAAVDGIQTGGGTAGGGDDYRKIETVVNIGVVVSVTAEDYVA